MKKLLCSLSTLAAFICIASCTKIRTTEIGSDLIPTVDNVSVFDTTYDVISELDFLADSTRIVNTANHAVGLMEDPSFGNTSAEIYFQMMATRGIARPFGPLDSIIGLDSVVLNLRYKTLYGDSNAIGNFRVYRISQSSDFRDSSLGYLISHPSFPVSEQLGAKDNVLFSTLNDSLMYVNGTDTVRVSNKLRIPLDLAFGNELMHLDSSLYQNDTLFNNYFKGFALKVDPGSPYKRALAYMNLADTGTYLTFHYRRISNGSPDTSITNFRFRSKHNANIIARQFSGTNFENNIASNPPGVNAQEVYLQSTPGTMVKIRIPHLQNIGNRMIYRAALIAEKLDGLEDDYFTGPDLLFLDAYDTAATTGNGFVTIPISFIGNSNLAMLYDPAQFGGYLKDGKYEFDLTRYVQNIATKGGHSFDLRLYAPYTTKPFLFGTATAWLMRINPIAKGRAILGGGAHPTRKMRLYIVYSKI